MARSLTPCHGETDLFFSDVRSDTDTAKAMCHACPLRRDCLQKALDRNEDDGVWGGFDPLERKFWRRYFGDVVPEGEIPDLPIELHRGIA